MPSTVLAYCTGTTAETKACPCFMMLIVWWWRQIPRQICTYPPNCWRKTPWSLPPHPGTTLGNTACQLSLVHRPQPPAQQSFLKKTLQGVRQVYTFSDTSLFKARSHCPALVSGRALMKCFFFNLDAHACHILMRGHAVIWPIHSEQSLHDVSDDMLLCDVQCASSFLLVLLTQQQTTVTEPQTLCWAHSRKCPHFTFRSQRKLFYKMWKLRHKV